MLTMPVLIGCWIAAFLGFIGLAWSVWKKRWRLILACYLITGFFLVAVPLKVAMPATSGLGMLFLTLVWPVWMLQTPLGFDMIHWFPASFWTFMFNFS